MQLPNNEISNIFELAEDPLIQVLYSVGKEFHILPFDSRLLSLTYNQLLLLLELITKEKERINKSQTSTEVVEEYEDPDFEKEFADVLNDTNPDDWVDI